MINRRTALKTLGLATASAVIGAGATLGIEQNQQAKPSSEEGNLLKFESVHQAGVITPQPPAVLLAALQVTATDLTTLTQLFKTLSGRIQLLIAGRLGGADEAAQNFPPQNTGEVGFDNLTSGQLSIMVGVGASLFATPDNEDRFGLLKYKPIVLKPMPSDFIGDKLNSALLGADIFLQISSDHPLLNLHAIRDILRYTRGQLKPLWMQPGFQRFFPAAIGEATARGLFGFKDGTSNPDVTDNNVMQQLIWTGSEEPAWAQGGTYLAVRLIREQLEQWDLISLAQQEAAVGRIKASGAALGLAKETQIPNYAADPNGEQVPLNSHIRKANPRLGTESDKRRFLRRGYLYFNGVDKDGTLDAGFLFMAFCRNIEQQFEYVKTKYMNNENFPKNNTGRDSLEENMYCIGGGYFYVLPGITDKNGFLGDKLLLS